MTDDQLGQIDVEVQACPALEELEVLWRGLEGRAAASFFLSWTWIGAWLEGVRTKPFVLIARRAGALVGLALIGQRLRKRYGISVPTLYLNQSGCRNEDSVFIEFNGFLVDRAYTEEVNAACLHYVLGGRGVPTWQEFTLSGVPESMNALARKTGIEVFERRARSCPYVMLNRVREGASDFITSLSKNTRYQIRRSLRLYQDKGQVQMSHASCLEEAQEWLGALEVLHQKSWTEKGQAGAFANPVFKAFCNRLLIRGFSDSTVDVVKVSAGPYAFGYLFNFIEGNRVLNYQSGFSYEATDHYKPGLVAHALAIQKYLDDGKSTYSFLAGNSQYKSSLSNASESLYWLSLQRDSGFLRLERGVRQIKSWIFRWSEGHRT